MQAEDFRFDGHALSELGFIIVQFGKDGGFQTAEAGSTLSLTTISLEDGRLNPVVDARYEETFSLEIGICKEDGSEVIPSEYRALSRWLCKPGHGELQIENDLWKDVFFRGSFTMERQLHRGRTVGFTCTFRSAAPFGYGAKREDTISLSSGSASLYNYNDELGAVYPDTVTIRLNGSGDLVLTNATEGRSTSISGCSSGEVITMDCRTRQLESNVAGHAILESFNFVFPRLYATLDSRNNSFTASLPCTVTFTYYPIIKVVV